MTADRRALSAFDRGLAISEHGYVTIVRGTTEASIRTSLASLAHLYGWEVEEEVVIPGWGRIDIVLRDGVDAPVVVELKIDLTKPARVRKAFQQADGYGRWWIENKAERPAVKLVGLDLDAAVTDPVARAYLSVHCQAVERFIGFLETGGTDKGREERIYRMHDRLELAERHLEYRCAAWKTLRREAEAQGFAHTVDVMA